MEQPLERVFSSPFCPHPLLAMILALTGGAGFAVPGVQTWCEMGSMLQILVYPLGDALKAPMSLGTCCPEQALCQLGTPDMAEQG